MVIWVVVLRTILPRISNSYTKCSSLKQFLVLPWISACLDSCDTSVNVSLEGLWNRQQRKYELFCPKYFWFKLYNEM